MANMTKIGVDVLLGGSAGVLDQIVQNMDEKRALDARAAGKLAATAKLAPMQQYGTYLNYGVPLLTVIASAMGWVRGDMETRLITAGAVLAGRKTAHTMTTGSKSSTPSAAYTAWRRTELAPRSETVPQVGDSPIIVSST